MSGWKQEFDALRAIGCAPGANEPDWVYQAEEAISFLSENERANFILIYAALPHAYIQAVLAPLDAFCPPDRQDLLRAYIRHDDTWHIEYSMSDGRRKMSFVEALSHPGAETLAGSDPLVFRRSFDGMRGFVTPIELSQKLVHCFGVHWMEERNAYCRLDDRGDIQDVIKVIRQRNDAADRDEIAVFVEADALAELMAVTNQALFRKFDFTRVRPGQFSGWGKIERFSGDTPDLAYEGGISGGEGSFVNGYQITRTRVTVGELIAKWEREDDPNSKRYETFKIHDWKNKRLIEVSCGPDGIVNYFTESDRPFEISPAFFRPEVLQRYKADPDKYEIRDRSINCRNAWTLKTYDINDDGQVHTYIGYLADLPYEEQQYWKLFNEWPKGPISKRAYQTDFEGNWDFDRDPLFELKRIVRDLDKSSPNWWKVRGEDLSGPVLYPATTSAKEWGDELLALDQLVVEGFVATELRGLAENLGVKVEKTWASLKLIEAVLIAAGIPEEEAVSVVAPLRDLHRHRSKVKGHAAAAERRALEKQAIAKHGSLRNHFRALVDECARAMDAITTALHAAEKS